MGYTKEEYYSLKERADKYINQKIVIKKVEYVFIEYTQAEAFATDKEADNFISHATLVAKSGKKTSKPLKEMVEYFEKQEQEEIKKDNLEAQ